MLRTFRRTAVLATVVLAAVASAASATYPTAGFSVWRIGGDGTQCSSPLSGCGDGAVATAAQLRAPLGIATDAAGNIYVADRDDHRVRKIAVDGTITTVAGSGAACASPANVCGDGGA